MSFTDANVLDTVSRAAPDYFGDGTERSSYFTFTYAFTIDQRNERRFPTQGRFGEVKLKRFGLGAGGINEPSLTTVELHGALWSALPGPFVLGSSLRYKHSFEEEVPYYLQEGLGYSRFVRGHEFYVIDGQDLILIRENLIVPLFKPVERYVKAVPLEPFRKFYMAIYLNIFFDAGRVWDDQYDQANFLANEWMSGYGAGLDFVTSYDQILRTEYSFNALGEHGFFLHFTQPF